MAVSQFKDTQSSPATQRDNGTPTHQTVEVSTTTSTNYNLLTLLRSLFSFLPQFHAVVCLLLPMSSQTHPSMPRESLCSFPVKMERTFWEMQPFLACSMAAGLDLSLIVPQVRALSHFPNEPSLPDH